MVFAHDNMYADPVIAWLEKVSPTFAPSTTLMSAPKAPGVEMELKNWEARYLKNHANAEDDVSPLL
jgi:hypothetical protein